MSKTPNVPEDTAVADAQSATLVQTKRLDTPATSAGSDADAAFLQTNELGAAWAQAIGGPKGGLSLFRSIDVDETEEEIKATPGSLYHLHLRNETAATKEFVKLYNATAANTTVGTTVPIMTIPITALETINLSFPLGMKFDTALCIAATTGLADNDTGAPAANAIIAHALYA